MKNSLKWFAILIILSVKIVHNKILASKRRAFDFKKTRLQNWLYLWKNYDKILSVVVYIILKQLWKNNAKNIYKNPRAPTTWRRIFGEIQEKYFLYFELDLNGKKSFLFFNASNFSVSFTYFLKLRVVSSFGLHSLNREILMTYQMFLKMPEKLLLIISKIFFIINFFSFSTRKSFNVCRHS